MSDKRTKNILLMLYTPSLFSGLVGKIPQVIRCKISQRVCFEPTPEIFYGIKFRSVRGKETNMKILCFLTELPNLLSPVRKKFVPYYDCRGFKLSVKVIKKVSYIRGIEVSIGKKAEVKIYMLSIWSNTQGSYCRDLLVRASSLQQNRCSTTGTPCPPYHRSHKQTAFVYEDNKGFQLCRFFLIRGQSSFIQRLISSSSRSFATLWGFWGVQPSECRSLLT